MFKSMDCDNLRETSQKMIVDTFAPSSSMRGGAGAGGRRRRGSRAGGRRHRKTRRQPPASIWHGIIN